MVASPVLSIDNSGEPPHVDTLEPFGLGWRWQWRKDRTWVEMVFRQLRKTSTGQTAEVTVQGSFPSVGLRGVLTVERLNLGDGNGRVKLANRLEKRTGEGEIAPINWRNAIDTVCSRILVRQQSGPDRREIGMAEERANNWLIEGLVEEHQTTSIYGDGEVGKSWLGLAACVAAVSGQSVVPGWIPTRRVTPIYLDWETDEETLNKRVRMICRGLGIPYVRFPYQFCDGPLSEQLEWLLERIQDDGIELIVIDSVEAAMQGSRSDGSDMNDAPGKMNQVLRKLGKSAILIDHVNSMAAQGKQLAGKAYGSIFKRNWTRMAFELKRTHEGEHSSFAHLGIYNTKRNNGPRFDARGLLWTINPEETYWKHEELTTPDLQQALPTKKRMVIALEEESPLAISELVERCESKPATIKVELSRNKGLFRKRPDGLIELVGTPEPELPQRPDLRVVSDDEDEDDGSSAYPD